ncbi:GNAT family N-acetyltransferase [Undibacterium sp.]|uniref:GNAT family N-acetyltransferase n=1 Tax=Undibacterium sp. TaxID=1914977 RepID=UPI00374CFE20
MAGVVEISAPPAFRDARDEDFESLLALRIAAMRPSLERVGRFDPQRARERLRETYDAAATRVIVTDGKDAGFVAVRPLPAESSPGLLLDHLYLHPDWQGKGLGMWALRQVFAEADKAGLPLHVGALRGSDANNFYLKHGFVHSSDSEWDIYYIRPYLPAVSA